MYTDVKQTIAVAVTAQLQKYASGSAVNITKARIMAISAQASAADASVKIYNTVGAATAAKLVAELKFGTAANEWTHFYVPGQGIYCDTGLYAVLSNCDFLTVTGTFT